jgi:hypothetical protein
LTDLDFGASATKNQDVLHLVSRIVGMKKTLVLVTLFSLAFVLAVRQPSKVQAAAASAVPQFHSPQEGKGCSAPKEWGQLRGVSDRVIAFEDSEGTIRVLDTGPCMRGETQLIVKITRP